MRMEVFQQLLKLQDGVQNYTDEAKSRNRVFDQAKQKSDRSGMPVYTLVNRIPAQNSAQTHSQFLLQDLAPLMQQEATPGPKQFDPIEAIHSNNAVRNDHIARLKSQVRTNRKMPLS